MIIIIMYSICFIDDKVQKGTITGGCWRESQQAPSETHFITGHTFKICPHYNVCEPKSGLLDYLVCLIVCNTFFFFWIYA